LKLPDMWIRIIVGIIFIPTIILLVWLGEVSLFLFVVLIVVTGLWEYYRLAGAKNLYPNKVIGMIAGGLLCLDAWLGMGSRGMLILTALIVITAGLEIFRGHSHTAILNTTTTVFGVMYVGWLSCHLIYIRMIPSSFDSLSEQDGVGMLLLAFVIPWFCDTSAYFTGKAIGRHKLIPHISAGKTIEGSVGGIIGTVVGLIALRSAFFSFLTPIHCIIMGGIGSIIAQIGDLAESLMKRDAGVKDSSRLIPGHGGVLDRFDSVLFAAPFVYYYLIFIIL